MDTSTKLELLKMSVELTRLRVEKGEVIPQHAGAAILTGNTAGESVVLATQKEAFEYLAAFLKEDPAK